MRIMDFHGPAFTNQMLDYSNHRAFAKIVSIFLEGKAKNTDPLSRQFEHFPHELTQARMTRSPTASWVTPSPISVITPIPS